MIDLNCFGGCGSGLGAFLIMGIIGGITITGLMIYIIIESFKTSPKHSEAKK